MVKLKCTKGLQIKITTKTKNATTTIITKQ